jgi:Caspase domain
VTVWLDRRESLPAGSPTTHALVIGTSQYEHLPAKEAGPDDDPLKFGLVRASTPATGAFRFARWLRDKLRNPDAPLGTVRLLLSPSDAEVQADAELSAAAAQVERANRQNVRTALLDWKKECRGQRDGVAILYISGHGISMSRTDSYVLLEDFAADENVMDYSVDVGQVHAGMAGENLPQSQFYFVDACRIRPDAFNRYKDAGDGLGLNVEWGGADTRAAPIYFSASPDTAALGQPGNGTLFSQALLESLEARGADDAVGDDGDWRVTTYSLQQALELRVDELAAKHGESQEVVGGGQTRLAVLHRFERPPTFPISVLVTPGEARSVAFARLWNWTRETAVVQEQAFQENPMTWTLPAGVYSLDVDIRPDTPPYTSKSGLAVVVEPRRAAPWPVPVAPS